MPPVTELRKAELHFLHLFNEQPEALHKPRCPFKSAASHCAAWSWCRVCCCEAFKGLKLLQPAAPHKQPRIVYKSRGPRRSGRQLRAAVIFASYAPSCSSRTHTGLKSLPRGSSGTSGESAGCQSSTQAHSDTHSSHSLNALCFKSRAGFTASPKRRSDYFNTKIILSAPFSSNFYCSKSCRYEKLNQEHETV